MNPRDLFALGVRLFGLWLICRGTTYVAVFAHDKLYPESGRVTASAAGSLIFATLDYSLALLFLLRANVLARWSYEDGNPVPAPGDPRD